MLSYYRSEDDINNGCKGSVKLAVCDVSGNFISVSWRLLSRFRILMLQLMERICTELI